MVVSHFDAYTNGIQTPKFLTPTPFKHGSSLHPKNLATYAFFPVSFELKSEPGPKDKTHEYIEQELRLTPTPNVISVPHKPPKNLAFGCLGQRDPYGEMQRRNQHPNPHPKMGGANNYGTGPRE